MNMRTFSIALMLATTPLLAAAEGQFSRVTDTDAFLLGAADSTGHARDTASSNAAGSNMRHCNQESISKHGMNDDRYDAQGNRRTPHEYRLQQGH